MQGTCEGPHCIPSRAPRVGHNEMAVNDKQAPCQVEETKSTAMQSYLVNAGVLYCCILEK